MLKGSMCIMLFLSVTTAVNKKYHCHCNVPHMYSLINFVTETVLHVYKILLSHLHISYYRVHQKIQVYLEVL